MRDYTVKEIAELLGVSKPTVQKVINDLDLPFITKGKRDRLYPEESVIEVIKVLDPCFDFSKITEKTENETQKPQNDTENIENNEKETEKNAKDRKVDDLQELLIQTLQKQIEDQQKQLESRDQEINQLHKLLDQQQVLTLQANKKIELLENKEEVVDPEPKEEYERSWFGLYRKVKK